MTLFTSEYDKFMFNYLIENKQEIHKNKKIIKLKLWKELSIEFNKLHPNLKKQINSIQFRTRYNNLKATYLIYYKNKDKDKEKDIQCFPYIKEFNILNNNSLQIETNSIVAPILFKRKKTNKNIDKDKNTHIDIDKDIEKNIDKDNIIKKKEIIKYINEQLQNMKIKEEIIIDLLNKI